MQTLINYINDIIGSPNFYHSMTGGVQGQTWDYGAMLEYVVAGTVLCIVISNVFKFIRSFFVGF